jgi:FlaA1/EpsC-like NDP-sugar epimerase
MLLGLGHTAVFAFSYWIAFGLRFDFQIPSQIVSRMWASLPAVLVAKLAVFYLMGHFHGWWRYVTFADLTALVRASLLSLLLLVLINHYVPAVQIPRVVVVLDCLVTALVLGILRASWRLYREHDLWGNRDRRLALMVGADHLSGVLAHQIHSHPETPYRVVGFLESNGDSAHLGTRLGSIPVLGPASSLGEIARSCRATDVLVAADALHGNRLRQLMDDCERNELNLKVIPSVMEQLNGRPAVRDIEINDLLRREPIQLDLDSLADELAGRTVMVTGAGGSIGSEICRQLLCFRPRRLVLVDYAENNLFLINNELAEKARATDIRPYVINVLSADRLGRLFQQWQPDYVFHAAAHKHVGLMEHNVCECVRNNVFGTKQVADFAHEFHTSKFVLISTDKAVNPASVMGATKQIAERYVHALAQESSTAFIVVRFGNVLGSSGSVVPIFKEQIRRGGPVTVTDERMTRFFMTIPEASQLVLQAASMGKGGEIFVLEMGDQVRIVDLARDLIRLSGVPANSIPIEVIGARPGEKLREELYFDEERMLQTAHPKLRAAYHRPYPVTEVLAAIAELEPVLQSADDVVRNKLQEIVVEYRPAHPDSAKGNGQPRSAGNSMEYVSCRKQDNGEPS